MASIGRFIITWIGVGMLMYVGHQVFLIRMWSAEHLLLILLGAIGLLLIQKGDK